MMMLRSDSLMVALQSREVVGLIGLAELVSKSTPSVDSTVSTAYHGHVPRDTLADTYVYPNLLGSTIHKTPRWAKPPPPELVFRGSVPWRLNPCTRDGTSPASSGAL